MAGKPFRYIVEYEDIDTEGEFHERGFASLPAARRFCRAWGGATRVLRTDNVVDVTPAGDPPGLLWEWDEVVIEDWS